MLSLSFGIFPLTNLLAGKHKAVFEHIFYISSEIPAAMRQSFAPVHGYFAFK